MRRKRVKDTSKSAERENRIQILFPGTEGGYVMKWLVEAGQGVDAAQPLCRCFCMGDSFKSKPTIEVVAPYDGVVTSLEAKVDEKMEVGVSPMIARMTYCMHDQVFNGLCCLCGRIPSQRAEAQSASNTALTGIEESVDPTRANAASITLNLSGGNKLVVSRNQAEDDRKQTIRRLFRNKKLLLVLDLDNTLLHATDDKRAPGFAESKGDSSALKTFRLPAFEGYTDVDKPHYLMLRPGLEDWLQRVSTMYELYIYTAGTRVYAEAVAKIMDPTKKLFGDRIISRTDVPELGKIKRLDRFFPVDNNMVLALDDRSDVWADDAYNLLTIRPYRYFENMQEMNQAPELAFEAPLEGTSEEAPSKRSKADINLKRAGDLLHWIHSKFYANEELTVEDQLSHKGSDVKQLLRQLRSRVLRDTHIFVNMSKSSDNTNITQLATACGATCSDTLNEDTKLVISNFPTHEKTVEAKLKLIWVVRPEWLYACIHNWHKEPQAPYSLFVLGSRRHGEPMTPPPSEEPAEKSSSSGSSSNNIESPPTTAVKRKASEQEYDEFGYPVSDSEEPSKSKAKSSDDVLDRLQNELAKK